MFVLIKLFLILKGKEDMTKKESHTNLIPMNNGMFYNSFHNYLVTKINKSTTGNIYYISFRKSESISIVFKIGIGDSKVFLNEISVSTYPNGQRYILGNMLFDSLEFDEKKVISYSKVIIRNRIIKELNNNRINYDEAWIEMLINILICSTIQNQAEAFSNIIIKEKRISSNK